MEMPLWAAAFRMLLACSLQLERKLDEFHIHSFDALQSLAVEQIATAVGNEPAGFINKFSLLYFARKPSTLQSSGKETYKQIIQTF